MAIQACRTDNKKNKTSLAGHAGLMLSTQLRTTGDKGLGKAELLRQAIAALKHDKTAAIYRKAWDRWVAFTGSGKDSVSQEKTMRVAQRLVVGLGAESVLETGLRLHYTYGTPLIPGSALKGLTAHYCHTVVGARDAEFQASAEYEEQDGKKIRRAGRFYQMLFGTNESSGIITFHDAWISPESVQQGEALLVDVMTTHHPKYYSGQEQAAPHDGEDPIPVHFLSTRGAFRIVLEAENSGADCRKWLDYTMKMVEAALVSWGVGGKTSSGYGRFEAENQKGRRS